MKTVPRILRRARSRERRSGAYGNGPGYVPSLTTLAGITVTPQTALTYTCCYAAVNVISTDLASLPRGVYRRLPGGAEEPAFDRPQHRLINQPNPEQTGFRFVQTVMGHALTWGNGPAEIVRRGDGTAEQIHHLNPATTAPKRTEAGRLYYEVDDGRGGRKPLLPENVLHVAGLGFDGLQGYSPVTLARQAIGLGIGAEEFGASLFGNGAIPKGVLKTPGKLSEAAAKNLRESFERVHQGTKGAHKVAVLEQGLEWVETQIPPEDAQFLATRQFQVLEIARIYRVPPHKLGDYSQAHLANLEESNLDYLQSTLLGWIVALEAEFDAKLFTEAERAEGYRVRFDMSALMRGNSQARVAYWTGLRNMGVATSSQISVAEGLGPIPAADGGDRRVMQGQYIPVEQLGTAPQAGTPRPPRAPEGNTDA